MEREVGGGIGMGNTCKPMAVSFQCMTKSTSVKNNNNNLKKKKQTNKKKRIRLGPPKDPSSSDRRQMYKSKMK